MTAQPPDGPPAEPGVGSVPADPAVPPPAAEVPFDPYRFGPPAHPIDPAYAPPGYVPPAPEPAYPTYGPPPGGYDPSGYQPNGPYAAPPPYGQTPYGQAPNGQPPYGQAPYGQAPNGQPPYGQAPYGQAPYGYAAAPGQFANVTNGLATTALVLGIIAVVLSWVPFFDALIFIPGIVFGIIGISAAKKRGGIGRTIAVVGLCLSVAAAAICIAFSAYVVANIHCSTVDDGFGGSSSHCTLDNN
jgi:hypothetical protein